MILICDLVIMVSSGCVCIIWMWRCDLEMQMWYWYVIWKYRCDIDMWSGNAYVILICDLEMQIWYWYVIWLLWCHLDVYVSSGCGDVIWKCRCDIDMWSGNADVMQMYMWYMHVQMRSGCAGGTYMLVSHLEDACADLLNVKPTCKSHLHIQIASAHAYTTCTSASHLHHICWLLTSLKTIRSYVWCELWPCFRLSHKDSEKAKIRIKIPFYSRSRQPRARRLHPALEWFSSGLSFYIRLILQNITNDL